MLDFARKLHEDLLLKLEELDDNQDTGKISPDQRIQLLLETIDQLKKRLKSYIFDTEEDEIEFFKHRLPLFLSLFIYYSEKTAIECSRRVGTEKSKSEFIEQIFQKIEYFFKSNNDFFNYCRFEKTRFDKYYFLRNISSYNDHLDLPAFMMDESFCTIYCWKVATINAYTRLEKEIRYTLEVNGADSRIENEETNTAPESAGLEWTDSKRGLTELIYSLQEQGSFNNGKADLKSIIRCFEKTFSVELGNTSSSYQQLLSRKKGSSSFLNKLLEKFQQRICKMEEQHIRLR